MSTHHDLSNFIWSIADLLRGPYRPPQYELVMLPRVVLRRFDQVPDAWVAYDKAKVGYEINFNRYFYRHTPPRPLTDIDADLRRAEQAIIRLLREVTRDASKEIGA